MPEIVLEGEWGCVNVVCDTRRTGVLAGWVKALAAAIPPDLKPNAVFGVRRKHLPCSRPLNLPCASI